MDNLNRLVLKCAEILFLLYFEITIQTKRPPGNCWCHHSCIGLHQHFVLQPCINKHPVAQPVVDVPDKEKDLKIVEDYGQGPDTPNQIGSIARPHTPATPSEEVPLEGGPAFWRARLAEVLRGSKMALKRVAKKSR